MRRYQRPADEAPAGLPNVSNPVPNGEGRTTGLTSVKHVETDLGLDDDRCQEAILARDHRFDGLFFTAVKTTRLYCRPISPHSPKRENFAVKRKAFTVKLDYRGTPFQKKVWDALLGIPFGETRTYGELAKQIGSPAAARSVGDANGKNPISIIGPCHRVIGSTGRLTGFAGGLEAKATLLRLEGEEVGVVPIREPDSRKAASSGSAPAGEPVGRQMDYDASAIRLALGKPASSDSFDELFHGAN
jgi:O-6-methylguanine DNA methyltransferase